MNQLILHQYHLIQCECVSVHSTMNQTAPSQYYTIEAFSGQQFPLTLVGVGQNNGTVPAVILSHTDPPSNNTVKTTGSNCSTLFYTISSDSPSVQLMLYPESPCNNISTPILTVSVNIKPCPPGFMLHNKTKSCTCDDTMLKLDIQCDINSQSFSHKHGVWVDYNQLNDHNKLLFTTHTVHLTTVYKNGAISLSIALTINAGTTEVDSYVEPAKKATASLSVDQNAHSAHMCTFCCSSH